MFTVFLTWLAIGAGTRLTLGVVLSHSLNLRLAIPQLLAGPVIFAAVLAKLTFLLPLPLGLVISLVLQDAVLVFR